MANYRLTIKLAPGDIDVDAGRVRAFVDDPAGPVHRDRVTRMNRVEAACDVPVQTGTLRATLRTQDGPGYVDVVVGRDGLTRYTGYVIKGTRPHVIEPRNHLVLKKHRSALRFLVGGRVVFARRVNHPGNDANDFLTRALAAAA